MYVPLGAGNKPSLAPRAGSCNEWRPKIAIAQTIVAAIAYLNASINIRDGRLRYFQKRNGLTLASLRLAGAV